MSDHNTVERARHRWREILPQLGIETRFLVNKHGPCPLCGGKDRFRFDDKDGEGTYFCGQCGAGNGLILVRKQNGWDFRTACDEIDKIIGTDAPPWKNALAHSKESKKDDSERCAEAIRRALAQAADPGVVDAYLSRRGNAARSPILQGHGGARTSMTVSNSPVTTRRWSRRSSGQTGRCNRRIASTTRRSSPAKRACRRLRRSAA